MALLLALLKPQPDPVTPADPPADIDKTDYLAQYNLWTRQGVATNPQMPERKGLALMRLYDQLYYSDSSKTELGIVLANLMNYTPLPAPAGDRDVIALRRELRKAMITEFQNLRGTYNP